MHNGTTKYTKKEVQSRENKYFGKLKKIKKFYLLRIFRKKKFQNKSPSPQISKKNAFSTKQKVVITFRSIFSGNTLTLQNTV